MCIVSFTREALNITIHNQYPGLELTSPVYYSNGTTCYVPPSQQIDTGSIMEARFGIDAKQGGLNGALLYKLQRKYTTKTGKQSNSNTASIKNTATNLYLFVAWNENYCNTFRTYVIECPEEVTMDEDKLWSFYWDGTDAFRDAIELFVTTWLIDDSAVMKIRCYLTYGSDYRLDIVISEGTGKYSTNMPMKLDPRRLVLLLLMLIVLTCVISLTIKPSLKLNIYNQCLNVDLISPTYYTDDKSECHRPPDYKVCAGDTMRYGCVVYGSDDVSFGALMYRVRKQTHRSAEVGEDTSSDVHLLIVWVTSQSKELYTDVLLVECDRGFDWEKSNLQAFCFKNIRQFRWSSGSITETWSLEDNVVLMTTFKINEDCIFDITISEVERDNNTRVPAHIALKR
jgi:hypothetical protein